MTRVASSLQQPRPWRTAQRRPLLRALLVALGVSLAITGMSATANALDYDRNDVLVREISAFVMAVPSDTAPVGAMVRGVARRQTRNFGLGFEVIAGVTTEPRPYVSVGGLFGFESSSNAWDRLRVYGEGGVGVAWNSNNPMDWLNFHVEGGTRILLSSMDRPHLSLTSGLRIVSSFRHMGWGLQIGVSWAFD